MKEKIKKEVLYVLDSEKEVIAFFGIVVSKNKKGEPIPTVIDIHNEINSSYEEGKEISDKLFDLFDAIKPVLR